MVLENRGRSLANIHDDLSQRVRDNATGRAGGCATDRMRWPPGERSDVCGPGRGIGPQRIELTGTRSERGVAQYNTAHCPIWTAGVADIDRMLARTERGQITAGIDETVGDAVATQGFDSAVDRKSLRDSAEIDFHAAVREADAIIGEKPDGLRQCRAASGARHSRPFATTGRGGVCRAAIA